MTNAFLLRVDLKLSANRIKSGIADFMTLKTKS
jgi:hypothetical protein